MPIDHADKRQYGRGRILRLIRRWLMGRQLRRCPETKFDSGIKTSSAVTIYSDIC